MLRGSYQGGRHPFIALYEMQPESWPFILQQTNNIISCGVFEVQALKEMKPFVIYALSYGLCQIRLSLLSLILEKLHSGECPVLEDWILESLVWQNLQVLLCFQMKGFSVHFFKKPFSLHRILKVIISTLQSYSVCVNMLLLKRMRALQG